MLDTPTIQVLSPPAPTAEPPPDFRPIRNLQHAVLDHTGPLFTEDPRYTGARAAGLRYERKAQAHLGVRYPSPESAGEYAYVEAPWIRFVDSGRRRYAQPDGLLINIRLSRLILIEIKLKHTLAAYWVLRHLYEPLLRRIFGSSWHFSVCEVVRWYDPSIRWPEPYRMTSDPSSLGRNEFGIYIYSRRLEV